MKVAGKVQLLFSDYLMDGTTATVEIPLLKMTERDRLLMNRESRRAQLRQRRRKRTKKRKSRKSRRSRKFSRR
tara:strand:- start:99 stop:317 length:219 start_codon:yes stop_codon:yes gene_type:complete